MKQPSGDDVVGTTPSQRGQLPSAVTSRSPELSEFTTLQIARELVARMNEGQAWENNSVQLWVSNQLAHGLREQTNLHNNRFGLARYKQLFGGMYARMKDRVPLAGATVIDVGCGGTNPGAFLFLLLILGAKRGIGIDLDEIRHPDIALRALADLAAAMLLDPTAIVGDLAPSRHAILDNIADIDFGKLAKGDRTGISEDRLAYWQQSASSIKLGDAEADLVFSNAFLEHVPAPDEVIRELARITKPGGVGVHVIDLTDHRRYNSDCHPLQFLAEPGPGMALGTNRMRQSHFVAEFEAHGFVIKSTDVLLRIDAEQRSQVDFSPYYASLSEDDLEVGIVRFTVQRT
tara:strand:- start:594 stop:1631 length:1038 start_codon:yes stop_codon:yes gene_type:complete